MNRSITITAFTLSALAAGVALAQDSKPPMGDKDMPKMEIILLEVPSAEGPMGAKGVGEIGLVPTAACVASALYAYDGETRYRLPMKESPAGKAMSVGRIRGDRATWR